VRIKGPTGFGDAIYMYPIVKHFIEGGDNVTVLTRHPYVFENLDCDIAPIDDGYDIDCNYIRRKGDPNTNQFQDMCIEAGIKRQIPLKLDYPRTFNNTTKRICLVQRPYYPMNEERLRTELMPDYTIMQRLIHDHPDLFFVEVGQSSAYGFKFSGIGLDMVDKTDYKGLLDLYSMADIVLSQIGYSVALAEALDTRIFVLFAQSGLDSEEYFFRTITPKKVITKESSYWASDSMEYDDIRRTFYGAYKKRRDS